MATKKPAQKLFSMTAMFRPNTIDMEKRTVELVFSSGAQVPRYDPYTGERFLEELSLDPAHVRLGRLQSGASLIDSHDKYSIKGVYAVTEAASVDGQEGVVLCRFSKRPDAELVWQDVVDGILRSISVGYVVHEYQVTEPTSGSVKIKRAIDWEPLEVSLVVVPADADAQVRNIDDSTRTVEGNKEQAPAARMERENMKVFKQQLSAPANEGQDGGGGGGHATAQIPAETVEQIRKAAEEKGQILERSRVEEIHTMVRSANLPNEFGEKLVKDGTSVNEARKLTIDEFARHSQAPTPVNAQRVERGSLDEGETRMQGMEQALLARAATDSKSVQLDERGRRFRSYSLYEMAREFARSKYPNEIMDNKMAVVTRALSTSDFPLLLANVASKSVMKGFAAAERTWDPIVTETELPDFKAASRVQLHSAPNLEKVGEGGEIKLGKLAESGESISLGSYAKRVAITRQTIINDDMQMLTKLPEMYGRKAADLISDLVWGIFIQNLAMADGITLFHANHKNLGTSGPISDTTLTEMRAKMRTQTDKQGAIVQTAMKHLIVPAALETKGGQFISQEVRPGKSADVNTFKNLNLIVEGRLDANSTTAFYGAGDKAQIDMIEVAYLQGQRGVLTETRQGWEVDGVEVKALLDVAAKALEFRGLQKNAGV